MDADDEERPRKMPRLSGPEEDADFAQTGETAREKPLGIAEDTSTAVQELSTPTEPFPQPSSSAAAPLSATSTSELPQSSRSIGTPLNDPASPSTTTPLNLSPSRTDPSAPSLSKSAQKKMMKKQEWEAGRDTRKVLRKARNAARKARARAQRDHAADSVEDGTPDPAPPALLKGKRNRHAASAAPLPVAIVLDCGFDGLMTDKEIVSLSSQITRCYAENAAAGPARVKLMVAGMDKRLKERFEGVLNGQYRNWKGVEVRSEPLEDVVKDITFPAASLEAARVGGPWSTVPSPASTSALPPSEDDPLLPASYDASPPPSNPAASTIYLTADSPHTLMSLEPYTTYVVGALVDRNRHKGICYARAEALGLRTGKLPLAEHLAMASRQVLATNHVVEIMLAWLSGLGWPGAFQRVVPARKGAVVRGRQRTDTEGTEDGGGVAMGEEGTAVQAEAAGKGEEDERAREEDAGEAEAAAEL